jgi:hypothetical protein
LTNDQFDDVEIRGGFLFWRGAYEIGILAAAHTSRRATAKRTPMELRSICYCGSAMAVTHSCECACGKATQHISQNPGFASQQNRMLDFRGGVNAATLSIARISLPWQPWLLSPK